MEILRRILNLALWKMARPGAALQKWVALLALLAAPAAPADTVSKEDQVKAVFLWRLAQFAEWPANRFQNTNSPIVIGVLGENRFGDALALALSGENASGRPLQAAYPRNEAEAAACHVLFISESEAPRIRQILARLRQKSILTVSDIEEGFLENGGMVKFRTVSGKVRLTINMEAAAAARLVLDARLLRIAEVIRRSDP